MRLTADLINHRGRAFISSIGERTLSLRGLKVGQIENLGTTKDLFGCLDLSDNDLLKLEDIPKLLRLRQLLVANNRISRIGNGVLGNLPQLKSLVMTNNALSRLEHLYPLESASCLERLSLIGNPVTEMEMVDSP